MRLGLRIGFFVAFTAVLPLLFLAFAASEVARSQVEARIAEFQVEAARSLGREVDRQIRDTQRVLAQQVSNFRLGEASVEAREAFLVTTYRLFPEIAIAALLDADGVELAAPLYWPEGRPSAVEGHDAVSEARLARFRAALVALARAPDAVAIGEAYRPDGSETAVVPMVFRSPRGDGVALAVELSLAPLAERMSALAVGREVCLLTSRGDVLLRAGEQGLVDPGRTRALLSNAAADVRYESASGVAVLAALAAVPGYDWAVIVAEPAVAATSTVEQIRARTWFVGGVALLIALIGGAYLTRSITGPVVRLRDATLAVGRGEFSRTAIEGRDELAELAAAFNRMSSSLEQSAAEIAAKNEEIERFNRELQVRVEQRTAQLREAQARLVQSGQLAAVGELSAGVAHELNNPLAGILGVVQILGAQWKDRPEAALLRAAEEQAVRCKEIVANLLRFTRTTPGGAPPGDAVVDLGAVLRDVLALVGSGLRQRGVSVEIGPTDVTLPIRGDASQLGRAIGQVLTSLRAVAAPGGTLRIDAVAGEGDVELRFELSPTVSALDDWRAAGLGFWVARQILEEHGATLLEPEGEPGGRRAWRLRAPRVER